MFYSFQSMRVPTSFRRGQWYLSEMVKSMRAPAQAKCKAGPRAEESLKNKALVTQSPTEESQGGHGPQGR